MSATAGGRPVVRRGSGAALVVTGIALVIGTAGVLGYAAADFHGNPLAGEQFLIGLTCVAVGGFVAYRRPDHVAGWLLLVAGAAQWMTFAGSSLIDWLFSHHPTAPTWVFNVLLHLATPGWILTRGAIVALLPLVVLERRRTVPATVWWWAASAAIAATCVAQSVSQTFGSFEGVPPEGASRVADDFLPWGHRAIWVFGLVALVGLFVRWLRAPALDRRRHAALVLTTAVFIMPSLTALTDDAVGVSFHALGNEVERWTLAALPVVVAVGVFRHGLFDIRVVVRRATVYVLLAALAAGAYVATVWLVSLLTSNDGAAPVVATGVVAVLVVPAYAWVQRLTARYLFGRRDDPYGVVVALGTRLAQAPPGERALELVTETVRDQLRIPFVGFELLLDGTPVLAASSGEPGGAVDRFAVEFQGARLGWLVVGRRSEHERFRPAEQALLAELARQAGVVAHNAALSEALRRSRAILLEAREEERQRIRRDLHDGLGPTLATVSLGLGAAADRLADDPDLASLLRDLEGELREAVADIRRLVYELRPPSLDDLGLVQAVRSHLRTLEGRTGDDAEAKGLRFELDAPSPRLELPSAVELAAYRVALEAMTNVVRHAHASQCWVRIDNGSSLRIRVDDDGVGLDGSAPPGVGLRSMRDRVHELGGTLEVAPRRPTGTRVEATFPLAEVVTT